LITDCPGISLDFLSDSYRRDKVKLSSGFKDILWESIRLCADIVMKRNKHPRFDHRVCGVIQKNDAITWHYFRDEKINSDLIDEFHFC